MGAVEKDVLLILWVMHPVSCVPLTTPVLASRLPRTDYLLTYRRGPGLKLGRQAASFVSNAY